jgi:hypothetical protein
MNSYINYKLIIFISLAYSLIVGSGYYGYGTDYYTAYIEPNVSYGNYWYDFLGWRLTTLTIHNKHIGVHCVSFILAISFGILLKSFFDMSKKKSFFFFILIYILALHTWPIIMSTSNAMRQGIVMSLVFLSFAYLFKNKIFKSFFFIFFSIFFHKVGIVFLMIFIIIFFKIFIINRFKTCQYLSILYLASGMLSFFLFLFLLNLELGTNEPSRIIKGDYRFPFLTISVIYILIFTYKYKFLKYINVSLFLYFFSFISSAVLFEGLNWEYERFMMMMTLPYILIFSLLLDKKSSYFFLFISFSLLLGMTIQNGMYEALK